MHLAVKPAARPAGAIRRTLSPADPVARALTWATAAASLSKGVFFSVSVLFFTHVAGFTAATVGYGLTIAGAAAVAAALGGGYLARTLGARNVLLTATAGQGLALALYLVVRTPSAFVLVACAAVGQQAVQRTALATMIAESFTGPHRVEIRARLRVVTNVAIAAGTALAAVALAIGTTPAYVVAMLGTSALLLASALPLSRLPATAGRVDRRDREVRRRSPLSDRTYLAATCLYAVMTMQFGLLTVGVPLWVAGATKAPAVTVPALLAVNTVIVSCLQVWAARGANTLRSAGRAVARAGTLLAAACGLYAAAAHGAIVVVIGVLMLATVAHSFAEILSEAGGWTLAFELADPANAGAYQGVNQTGMAIGTMLAPLVVTATAIEHGSAGWAALAALFLATGLSTRALVRSRRGARAPGVTTGSGRRPPRAGRVTS